MEAVQTQTTAEGSIATWAGSVRVTAGPDGIRAVWLPAWDDATVPRDDARPRIEIAPGAPTTAEQHLRQALAELAQYFAGARQTFTVALDAQGTDFYRRVWAEVARVPYGETRSYGEIARAVGAPGSGRAVGAANGANPVAPFVPCHRIIGSDGRLTGYGPGLPLKRRLLVMEGALPAGEEDYAPWVARVAARLGGGPLYVGVRAAGAYCRPECARARRNSLPARVFRSPAEAERAGFAPCPLCIPAAPAAPLPLFAEG